MSQVEEEKSLDEESPSKLRLTFLPESMKENRRMSHFL